MFGLFKKKKHHIPVTDKIWMEEAAKWQGCLDLYRRDPTIRFLSWFEESRHKFVSFLTTQNAGSIPVQDAAFCNTGTGTPVFIEHFPSEEEEQRKFEQLGLNHAIVCSSLDEPIFGLFGGEKIIQLMQQMGMQKQEMIEHKLISASIRRAQEKIAAMALLISSAPSQAAWLEQAGIRKEQ